MKSCLIIGAGMTGLVAARELQQHGVQTVVLDKGHGVGGRMATRRIENAVFDHGAQFFTARSAEFKAMVAEWREAGAVVEWCRGFSIDGNATPSDNFPRYRGNTGMTSVAKLLARGMNVHLNQQVLRVEQHGSAWHAVTESGEVFEADSLVLTAPVPQSLAVLDAGNYVLPPNIRHQLGTIIYEPCIALLALLEGSSAVPQPGAIQFSGEPISWIADNYQKGISPRPGTITIHAGPKFSRSHWEADDATIVAALTERARQWLGHPVVSYQVQRWRYSKVAKNHPWPCLAVESPAPLVFAGDAFAGAKIEGAAMSGLTAAQELLSIRSGKQ